MLQKFDLVVVGASFAGLSCARTAALRGLSVAVVDSKPDVGARIRTTGIVVKEVTDAFDLPAHLLKKIRGVRLYAPNGRSLDLHAPGYYFQATDTAGLLRWLATEAERAGARLLLGRKFESANADETGITIPAYGIRTKYLVGADGARSRVAAVFGLGRNRRFLAGAEMECETLPSMDPRFLHCFADSRIAPAYIGWVLAGCGMTQLGAAARLGSKPDISALVARAKNTFGVQSLSVIERRGGLIPAGGPVEPLGRGRVLLIGDAAGLVSPVTGGGIHTALHFGRRAAQLVSDYLLDRGAHPVQAMAAEIPRFRFKRVVRQMLDLAPPNSLINLLLLTPPMRLIAQRLYFHSRGGNWDDFESWQQEFEARDYAPRAPTTEKQALRCV
ncbi:MAG TPA: NAD(P)/FAD-dependent oxidoreductase [Rhizomicrobium sp.]|nr:NAD(P)/FAD-dependent oxidoreductase [Rhizomicrobium sp.]